MHGLAGFSDQGNNLNEIKWTLHRGKSAAKKSAAWGMQAAERNEARGTTPNLVWVDPI